MSVFKCKMCGGTIEFEPGTSVGVCDHCGTKQTLPRLDDDRRANLYDRADHFRRNNDFDKAAGIYETLLNEDKTDAEAYWLTVLCHYGVEYVEDPATRKRIPTVNRAQFTSIFDDADYRSALEYADAQQRSIYEAEAASINEIQKGILAISQKEEPFDVFICYKETDAQGRRTPDSVLANDLYHQLVNEGFKVFFSRITLEDKLGTAYEPYIFAALNSAKVMVALGTKPEYFNAVWVKNEWNRYLALVKASDGKKVLIPAYRDMDPYDLPEEFSHLQAQDMSKLGFMQDLIRGIKKLTAKDEPQPSVLKETVVKEAVGTGGVNVESLLKRAFLFLEDGDWNSADEYAEKVLDQDPENGKAYLVKLLVEQKIRKQEELRDCAKPFDGSKNYQKALRFGDAALADTLKGYVIFIKDRNETARLTGIYNGAVNAMNAEKSEAAYRSAADAFKMISGFKDADALAEQCLDKAEVCRKDAIYASAQKKMTGDKTDGYEAAIKRFSTISGWKDADEQIYACQRIIEEIKEKEEADRLEAERKAEACRIAAEKAAKKRKKVIAITALTVAACIPFLIVLITVIIPNIKYYSAVSLIGKCKYVDAYESLISLNGYKDSTAKAKEIYEEYKAEKLKTAKVGDNVFFGSYEQDNNASNGKEDIEWLVLEKESDKTLVISRYALDCQQYNTTFAKVTWETCSMRKWLNGTFINNAFNSAEQSMIQTTTVTADKNPSFSTSPGNNTTDKVFLLSITEANKYFGSDSTRQCQGTAYCYAQGAYKASNGNCWWWLRSPGDDSDCTASVGSGGSVNEYGRGVRSGRDAVRPALWINLGS